MTLAEIKIQALHLMFANNGNIDEMDMALLYANKNTNQYLYAMPGSIDRCFHRIMAEKMHPTKVLVLTGGTEGDFWTSYDLTDIADFFAIDRVVFENYDTGEVYNNSFRIEATTLYIFNHTSDGQDRLIYYPELPLVATLEDTDTVDLPDNLCNIIPYFVAGELYTDEQPAVAMNYRNMFEQMLESLRVRPESSQKRVKAVYKQ